MERLLSLDDAPARDPLIAGGKAAALARARAAGLPALPGWIVTTTAGAGALRAGAVALERSGPPRARLALAEHPLEDGLIRDLQELGPRLASGAIVRSSTVQEVDPRWAGAFATYLDVRLEDLPVAIRACWASAFSRDVLSRCDAMGLAPADLAMAILIQAWVPFDAGGTAEAHDDGSVLVTAVDGSPDVLVAGRADGVVALVGLDGAISRRDAGADVGSATFRAVADLARRTMQATGDRAIEWGTSAGRLALLQVRRAPAAADAGASTPLPPRRSLPPSAERLALLAMRFPGPLGERLVLPWAFALREPPPPYSVEVLDPVTAIAEVIAVARALTAEAWGRTPAVAEREAAETMRLVLGPEPERGIERLSRLRPVDPAAAARVPAMVSAIGRALTSTGALGRPEMVWRLSTDELVSAAAGAAVPARLGPDRWEPFLFAVAATNGLVVQGTGASPGIGAGRLRILRGPAASWRPEPREILAIPAPVPQVSPLLWNAAGLVALGGNVGAHVFEVARSLGVPAVVGVDVPQARAGALAAVDGASGRLSVLGLPNESLGTKGA